MPDTPKSSDAARPRTRSKAAAQPKPEPRPAEAAPSASRKKAGDSLGEGVARTVKRVGKSLEDASKTWAEGNAEIGLTMIDQAEQNVQQAFAAMRAAAKAKDISEVMKIHADFVRQQGERSMGQARRIGELIVQVGRDSVTPLRPVGGK